MYFLLCYGAYMLYVYLFIYMCKLYAKYGVRMKRRILAKLCHNWITENHNIDKFYLPGT